MNYIILEHPIESAQFDNGFINSSKSRRLVSKSVHSVRHSHAVEKAFSSSSVKKARISAANIVQTNSSRTLATKNRPLPMESNNKTDVQSQNRHQQKIMKKDIFIAKKMLRSQEESLNVINQIQKRASVKFHPSIPSGGSQGNDASVKKPSRNQKTYHAPEVQGTLVFCFEHLLNSA